jgi:hypothetical protein
MLRIVPVAIAIALATGACAMPGSRGGLSSAGSSVSSNSSGSSGSSGLSSGSGSGGSASASGMTPDEVALWCTNFNYAASPESDTANRDLESWQKLRKATPVQLQPNVDTLIADYQAMNSGKRIYAQVKDELLANYQPLKEFHDQICVAH